MKRICFVCLGNICRSPMAEFIMKAYVKENQLESEFIITSAGTAGYHDKEDMHSKSKEKLRSNNIQLTKFESKKLTQKICDENDLIIALDNNNFKDIKNTFKNVENKLYKLCDFAKELHYKEVPDPWYTQDFDETYMIISIACKNLLQHLTKKDFK